MTGAPSPTRAQAAVRYAQAGWPVFPLHHVEDGACSCAAGPQCRNPGKHPRTTNGFHDATRDPTRAGVLWARWPNANLGVPTGRASGLVVIDLDGQAGRRSWQQLLDQNHTPQTATVRTPHGWHVWYRLPSDLAVPRAIRLRDGLDVLGDRGYAIVPPSRIPCSIPPTRHQPAPCTGGYTWTRRGTIAVLPEWVADLADQRAREEARLGQLSQSATTPQRVREGDYQTNGVTSVGVMRRWW